MLSIARSFCALSILTVVAVAVGCGSDDEPAGPTGPGASSSSTGGAGATGGAGGAGAEGGEGGKLECTGTEGTTLALTTLNFGHGTSGQWKKVGLDIDGVNTTNTFTDHCMPNNMADEFDSFPDGDNGIDNAFGHKIVPKIIALRPDWPQDINDYLEAGDFNALVKMYCLPETGDVNGMVTKVFGGTNTPEPPKYDGTDLWPVAPELLADAADAESSTIVFPDSTVTGQLYDSGEGQTFVFTLPMHLGDKDTTLKLVLHAARVQMELADDRKSATKGVIAGVLDTEEFIAQVNKIGWLADMCGDDTFNMIVGSIRQASDIMVSGTQDSSAICNGISLGVNFEMKEVQIGEVAPPAPAGEACQ